MIWGLPISLFTLMMLSILASLLVTIFSFGLWAILLSSVWNATLYVILTKIANNVLTPDFGSVFPRIVSNKQKNLLHDVNYQYRGT